jgi:hypothetical protein
MNRGDDVPARADQTAALEQALIAEFLERRGLTATQVGELPADERLRLWKQASAYASSRLAEVESRAHFVNDLHHHD